MAKAVALTPDVLKTAQITPRAATPARSPVPAQAPSAPKPEQVPLQVRIPKVEARAIKIAAAEADLTISDFMLACFHAHMKSKSAR